MTIVQYVQGKVSISSLFQVLLYFHAVPWDIFSAIFFSFMPVLWRWSGIISQSCCCFVVQVGLWFVPWMSLRHPDVDRCLITEVTHSMGGWESMNTSSFSLLFSVHELGGFAFSCTPNLITNLPLSPIAWNWSIIDQYLPKLHKMDHLFLWICYLRLIAVMTERWVTQFCSLFHTGELNQHKRILVYISQ